jgi:two-component sensor histidine kinase
MTPPDSDPLPVVEPAPQGNDNPDMTAHALKLRLRQQEILSELGVLALQGTPVAELMQAASTLTAEGLQAEFSKVLEYLPEQNRLLVRAGIGWPDDVVGHATIGADLESPAGYALRTGKPVISNHLEHEERFRTPELLLENGIHRAMNVILQGDGSPFGVLEVDSRTTGEFTKYDIAFLQGAANVLGMAIERQRIERDLKAAVDLHEVLLQEGNHRVANSLQLVSSMLGLQANSSEIPEVRDLLHEAVSRISAIARAHQRLFRSHQIHELDIGRYLRDVCHDMDEISAQCTVSIEAEEGIMIGTDRAVPVALMVVEIITNSAKHAYKAGDACPIWVTLKRDDPDTILLSVRDEGLGLPPDFDPKGHKGLGMRLVSGFVSQLHADIQVERRAPGTEFILKIPIRAPSSR